MNFEILSYEVHLKAKRSEMSIVRDFMNITKTLGGALLLSIPWISYETINDQKVLRGPLVGIINDLENHLDVKFQLHYQNQPIWGLKLPNGTWTGFYGMIQRKIADVILIPTAASSERLELVEFSYPFYSSAVVILAGGSSAPPVNLFAYVMTFNKEVWMALFFSVLVLVLLSSFVDYFYGDSEGIFSTVSNHLWNAVASFFLEATLKNPSRQLGRILLGVWLLSTLTLMSAFSGQFKSSLTLRKEGPRIESIQDLSETKDTSVQVWKGTVFEKIIMNSDLDSLKKVAKLVIKSNGLVNMNKMYLMENFRLVRKGKTVFITEASTLKSQLAKQCKQAERSIGNMYLAKETVVPVHLYMALSRNLKKSLRETISNRLMTYAEAGLMEKWINDAFGDWKRCIEKHDDDIETNLGLSDLGSVFILLGISLSFAALAFLREILVKNYAQIENK